VLLGADPLATLRDSAQIEAVVANGRYFPEDALAKMLADVRAAYEGGGRK
jgi:hypothetical protein